MFRRLTSLRSYATQATAHGDYDLVIVGGGPAGLALASSLAASPAIRQSTRIALIEASSLSRVRAWDPPPNAYSNRVSSITNASKAFLQSTGAWTYVDESRTNPIDQMQVWDGLSDARIQFDTAPMAHLTENLNLQRGLLRHLDQLQVESAAGISDCVTLLDETKVQNITTSEHGWPLIHTSTGQTLRARLLVGADGPNSPVRAFAGVESSGWAYPTRAIVATLDHPPHYLLEYNTAYQRHLPTGPIAFLPLSPTSASLVWSTTPELAEVLQGLPPNDLALMINAVFRLPEVSLRWLYQLLLEQKNNPSEEKWDLASEIAFRERVHSIHPHSALSSLYPPEGIPPEGSESYPPIVTSIQQGTVASFPLRMSHADSYLGPSRTALLGDAAHTIHPLAGQGLNLSLADAQSLSTAIQDAVQTGGDIGSYTTLINYPRERYFTNHMLLSATDKMHKLYSATLPPIVWARSVGLEVVNELGWLKDGFMGAAGGTRAGASDPYSPSNTAGHSPSVDDPQNYDSERGSAPTSSRRVPSPSPLWNAAASGIETATGVADFAKAVGDALGGWLGETVRTRLREAAGENSAPAEPRTPRSAR